MGKTDRHDDKSLLPCPFCGSADLFVERADYSSAFVQCNGCAMRGPVECQQADGEDVPGEAAAKLAWNRRASTVSAERDNWISVHDRLPNDGEMVLTWDGKNRCIEDFNHSGFGMRYLVSQLGDADDKGRAVTHWQPLPATPNAIEHNVEPQADDSREASLALPGRAAGGSPEKSPAGSAPSHELPSVTTQEWEHLVAMAREQGRIQGRMEAASSSTVPSLDAAWCVHAFWRVNPGGNATVPSLYLLDFAREVLRTFAPSAIGAKS